MSQPMVSSTWAQRAQDPRQPLWLRVYALTEDQANNHGHARLDGHEEIRLHLGDDTLAGSQISRAIRKAIEQGWLAPASSARCLCLSWATRDPQCLTGHRVR